MTRDHHRLPRSEDPVDEDTLRLLQWALVSPFSGQQCQIRETPIAPLG